MLAFSLVSYGRKLMHSPTCNREIEGGIGVAEEADAEGDEELGELATVWDVPVR